jgi:tRNA-Thr(GGU) m(6)t(6)A37 methyltransferase TsaA
MHKPSQTSKAVEPTLSSGTAGGTACFDVRVIGRVESPLRSLADAPKQGEEGAPLSVLVFQPSVEEALRSVRAGDTLLLFTWLDRADRNVLQVHPRDDRTKPLHGVFSTRSPHRPNPIGLHRVTVVAIIDPLRFQVRNLEALDHTPIIDVKAMLEGMLE